MQNAKTLARVHTHTHTCNLINKEKSNRQER